MKSASSVLRRTALILTCLFLASCDSTNPLSSPEDSKPDAALAASGERRTTMAFPTIT